MEIEGVGLIDISIAPFVEKLNREGFTTLASCSGLMHDHTIWTKREDGYLSFLYEEKNSQLIKLISEQLDLEYSEGECYLKPAFTLRFRGNSDEAVREKWRIFEETLFGKRDA
ncbi:hypothetical protein PP175_26345 (plasmid) [Aneurinibacillus sp. Ricciae_BoGa-3]|uniref:hypothetical protein n=1 Tax=Aneurinibacillus sp. Ricciae_BoGa-3 TaxID=3022697 RepID=UPI0023427BD0|nr:hypothetical protein [Aneurinibacillus sp. Ricciae_BoGa-3]WCK57588.1 hypothetical protein PP175_26345 [Aneurinibacillus sp. Ricciae_BoGa-3]